MKVTCPICRTGPIGTAVMNSSWKRCYNCKAEWNEITRAALAAKNAVPENTRLCDCKFGYIPSKDAEDAKRFRELNTPEIRDFMVAVEREALHQRDRWGASSDAGKTDADWFWLIGYLAGKAIHKPEKALHHIITTAAACLNWHAAKLGVHNAMRPGIDAAPKPDESAT